MPQDFGIRTRQVQTERIGVDAYQLDQRGRIVQLWGLRKQVDGSFRWEWIPVNDFLTDATLSDTINVRILNNIRHADQFPGANAGEQIANAIQDLPSTGGTVDCTSYEGTQTIATNIFATGANKDLMLIFGTAIFNVSVAQSHTPTNKAIYIRGRGLGTVFTPLTNMTIFTFNMGSSNMHSSVIEDIAFNLGVNATHSTALDVTHFGQKGVIERVFVKNDTTTRTEPVIVINASSYTITLRDVRIGIGAVNADGIVLKTNAATLDSVDINNCRAAIRIPDGITVTGLSVVNSRLENVVYGFQATDTVLLGCNISGNYFEQNLTGVNKTIEASPTGAVRVSGTTTITTTTAHGYVANNTVNISGVTDSSFNGTFTVVSVPSSTTFTYSQATLGNATSGSGAAETGSMEAIFIRGTDSINNQCKSISIKNNYITGLTKSFQDGISIRNTVGFVLGGNHFRGSGDVANAVVFPTATVTGITIEGGNTVEGVLPSMVGFTGTTLLINDVTIPQTDGQAGAGGKFWLGNHIRSKPISPQTDFRILTTDPGSSVEQQMLQFNPIAGAVNWWTMQNSAAGGDLQLVASGTDGNIALGLIPKKKYVEIHNNNDSGTSWEVLRLKAGNPGTAANNDEGYIPLYLKDSVGNQAEFARMTWKAQDVTSTSKDTKFILGVMSGNTLTNMIAVDGLNKRIGFGILNPVYPFDYYSTNPFAGINFESENSGAGGPLLRLFHNSSSPASVDGPGQLQIWGKNSVGGEVMYGAISCHIVSPSTGNGRLILRVAESNNPIDMVDISPKSILLLGGTQVKASGGRIGVQVNDISYTLGTLGSIILPVDAVAGTPTDAEFGNLNGAMAWNSASKEFYIRDSATEGWNLIGTGGAVPPVGAAYVTIGNDATLTAERALTGTANRVIVTDNGPNSTVVLSTPQDIHTEATPTFNSVKVKNGAAFTINLIGTPTANRTSTFQDETGLVAFDEDYEHGFFFME